MRIDWQASAALEAQAPSLSPFLQLTADACQVAEGVVLPCAVHVELVDDAYIRDVNARHRGIDRATDVLSFPAVSYPQGKTAKDCPALLRREVDPDVKACMLGDILISWPHAQMQAMEFGHSLRREICYLLAHGLCHLFGYDHMEANEQKEMRHMEEKALHLAGISRGGKNIPPTDEQLLALARLAMERSYSPYSHFPVGACLLSKDGRVFQGCNIENASFGLTNCAERTAMFKAVSEGVTEFEAIAIAAKTAAPYPCGACRQVLNEFAPGIRILVTWDGDKVEETTLPALLPHGFGPKDLP